MALPADWFAQLQAASQPKPAQSVPPAGHESGGDFIRGSINVPLAPDGIAQAVQLGKQFAAKGGLSKIVASDLVRAQQTAQAISHFTGAQIATSPTLHPWHLGEFEGQPTAKVIDKIHEFAQRKQDLPISGQSAQSSAPGESFNSFKARTLGPGSAIQAALAEHRVNPDAKIALVTHLRDVKLTDAWVKAGAQPSLAIHTKTMVTPGDEPASVHRLFEDNGTVRLEPVNMRSSKQLVGGVYIARHGRTSMNGK